MSEDTNTQDTPTTNGDNGEQENNLESLHAQYQEIFGKDVSNAKKNDVEWIKSKIEAGVKNEQNNNT